MSKVEFDENGYKEIQKKINKVQNAYSGLWGTLNANRSDVKDFLKYDKEGLLAAFIKHVEDEMRRVQNLSAVTDQYYALWKSNQSSGKSMVEDLVIAGCTIPLFSTIGVDYSNVNYENALSYQFKKSGQSFEQYNDWKWFMETTLYKAQSYVFTATSELTNWKAYLSVLGGSQYEELLMEDSIAKLLDAMPEEPTEINGMLDCIQDVTGIPNLKTWLSTLASLMKEMAGVGMSRETFFSSKDFEELVMQLSPASKRYITALIKALITEEGWQTLMKDMKGAGTVISNATKYSEYLDVVLKAIQHYVSDFSTQISYLDTIEQALLNSGVNAGLTASKIQEMRKTYASTCEYALDKVKDLSVNEIVGMVKKGITDSNPALKYADFGLKLLSAEAKLFGGKYINADKSLMGLIQIESSLMKSYNTYLDMIDKGIATTKDVQEADKLFELIRNTKLKEYENMMILAKDSGYMPQLKAKYEELKNWVKE